MRSFKLTRGCFATTKPDLEQASVQKGFGPQFWPNNSGCVYRYLTLEVWAVAVDCAMEAKGYVHPLAGRGLKLSYAGFAADVPVLASGKPGRNRGLAGSVSLPFAADRGNVVFGLAQSRSDDGAAVTGRAFHAEASVLATLAGEAQSLTFTVSHTAVEAEFYSALNPALIPDEARTERNAAWYAPQFQADPTFAHALDNLAHKASQPTDRFREATLDL